MGSQPAKNTTSPPGRLTARLVRYERPLLFVLLSLLLLVLLQGSRTGLGRTLFVVHLGVFLLWQPFIASERRLSPLAMVALPIGILAAAWFLTPWLLVGWLMLLGGVIGGKVLVFGGQGTRLAHLVALGMVVVALLMLAVPAAYSPITLPGEIILLGRWLMLGGLLAILLMPYDPEPEAATAVVDFIYSVFMFLILAVLVLGTLAAMQLFASGYVEALLQATLGFGLVLLLLGWSWNPLGGLSGIGSVVSRYTLSLGVPVEQWLETLARIAEQEQEPATFLHAACEAMVRHLRWIVGVRWSTASDEGSFGRLAGPEARLQHGELTLAVHTRTTMSPSMIWHVNLLARLLAEFHADKRRAQQLKRLSYMEAVHETGARLTHDIKNLLQSLNTLCAAVEIERNGSSPEYQALLRRQLPAIAARLQETLEKMRVPTLPAKAELVAAGRWWENACRHFGQPWIEFDSEDVGDLQLPAEVFDGVLDNVVRNVAEKRLLESDRVLRVRLERGSAGACLNLCDDGRAFPAAVVAGLFQGPVASESGLGIGLFQAARQAEQAGYRLALAENRDGRVCLSLQPSG